MSKKVKRNLIGRSGVYAIKRDGEVFYIGSSGSCLESRYSNHKSLLRNNRHHNKLLQEVFNDNGKLAKFDFEVLEYCSPKDVYIREKYYMTVVCKDCGLVNRNRVNDLDKLIRSGRDATEHRQRWSKMMSNSNNPNNTKLNELQVKEILYLKNQTDMKQIDIAKYYGVSDGYVSNIGKSRWVDVKEEVKPAWYINKNKTNAPASVEVLKDVVNI